MKKFSWLKDSLIQIFFISFAVVFTVFIAQISLSEQYTTYYENKLESKAESLARNAVSLFAENNSVHADGIRFILDIIFPVGSDDSEIIRYALFDMGGQVVASTVNGEPVLPDDALHGGVTYKEAPFVRSFCPLLIDGAVSYILMVQIDDKPFMEHSAEMSDSLYSSLFRGCLFMGLGYALFSAISNLRKKKEDEDPDEEPTRNPRNENSMLPRLSVQLLSMFMCAVLALPLYLLYTTSSGSARTAAFFAGVLFVALAGLHVCRILLWFVAWYSKRPISTYSAQTLQFFVFLVIFLTMYVLSIQNGYSTQINLSKQNELRLASVFAGISLSGGDSVNQALIEQVQDMEFGIHPETHIVVRTGDVFTVFDDAGLDISEANDLFFSAWESQQSVTGLRGGYKYGVTVIADSAFETMGLAVVRQSASILADEMHDAMIDFLLAMSATVFAFVFLFVEMNRILEVINIPNTKRERGWRYAKGTRCLMFFATACRYIPLYFFVLIVHDIYEHNPVSWLPMEIAMVLPIAVVLLIMAVGRDLTFLRLNARKMMLLGCFIGLTGFLSLNFAVTLPVLLLLLVYTYTGLSMVYNGLWDYATDAANTGYKEFNDIKEHTLSGEYLGGTAGAVIGAMVYDKFGLFAAFALSAVICVFGNILVIAGLLLFALMPGLITLYATSALIGVSIGLAKNIIANHYSELEETSLYAHSGSVYNLFDSLFGLLGAALFTLAHFMSAGGGEYVLAIAGIVAVATLFYPLLSKHGRAI